MIYAIANLKIKNKMRDSKCFLGSKTIAIMAPEIQAEIQIVSRFQGEGKGFL